METLIILVALTLAIVALVKANSSSAEIWQLKQRIQRLQDQLDEFKNRFSSSQPPDQTEQKTANKPKVTQPKQAALVVPEPVTSAALQQEKQETALPPPPPQPPPPPPALDQEEPSEPEPEPEPARPEPEPVAAAVQAESPLPDKVDAKSIEMKLGTYWFVRIGVMLMLTGLGTLAYYKKQFFIEIPTEVKVCLFYLLSAALGGLGFWLRRTKENLNNFGQVLIAGGFSGVYFTTYAAHVFPPVQVIENTTVALLLLFSWGGFMVWFADRIKSETIALFATGASYYATYVPLIHTGDVSHWVILFSNLILAVAAVVFMLRNRWLKLPVLSMAAAYAGFFFWRIRVDESSLLVAMLFIVGLWVVYTAAVFLSQNESFDDRMRAAFLTANNAAMFGLLTIDVMKMDRENFWILPMAVGMALLGCTLAATRFLKDQSLSCKSYLTQGLVLVTLGLMTMNMSDSIRGPIFAAESIVLLFMAIRRKNLIIQISSFCVAIIAAVYALLDTAGNGDDFLFGGLFTGVILLFNAWLCHHRLEASNKSMLRLRVSCLTGVGLFVGLIAFLAKVTQVDPLQDWAPAILLATTVLFTGSVYRLKIREFLLLGQAPALLGLLLSLGLAVSASELTGPLLCALALTLGQAHWWRWQQDKLIAAFPDQEKIKLFPCVVEAVFSGGLVMQWFAWITNKPGIEWETWIWAGSLTTIGMSVYAVITRARFIGLFSQVFLGMSCLSMVALFVQREDTNLFIALIPVATLLLMNFATSVPVGRIGQLFESVRIARFGYRCVAAVLGLLWIDWFVASDSVMLVYVLVGVALFLGHALKQQREWLLWALIYAAVGLIFLMGELEQGKALWQSASGIIAVLMTQQLARRRERQFSMPELAHTVLILAGGIALFFWLTVKVFNSDWGSHSLLTLTWTILALGYLGLGLGLKERWYWLMGLGTLAIALLSVTIEFINGEAYWTSLLAIAVLFVGQQLARRRGNEVKVPDGVHKWLILVGGTLLFTWLSIKVSDPGDLGLSTLTWTILALGYFGFGLGLKERWYRLMGLGTLAIALVSLVPIIWRMWRMNPLSAIPSFFVMGLVFIGLGFVYTRFKDKIKKLL